MPVTEPLTQKTESRKNRRRAFFKKALVLVLALQLTAGCVPFWKRPKPAGPPELPSATQESWCYRTLAKIDCYATPQDFPPDRLVAVQPTTKTPRTQDAYKTAQRESLTSNPLPTITPDPCPSATATPLAKAEKAQKAEPQKQEKKKQSGPHKKKTAKKKVAPRKS